MDDIKYEAGSMCNIPHEATVNVARIAKLICGGDAGLALDGRAPVPQLLSFRPHPKRNNIKIAERKLNLTYASGKTASCSEALAAIIPSVFWG